MSSPFLAKTPCMIPRGPTDLASRPGRIILRAVNTFGEGFIRDATVRERTDRRAIRPQFSLPDGRGSEQTRRRGHAIPGRAAPLNLSGNHHGPANVRLALAVACVLAGPLADGGVRAAGRRSPKLACDYREAVVADFEPPHDQIGRASCRERV